MVCNGMDAPTRNGINVPRTPTTTRSRDSGCAGQLERGDEKQMAKAHQSSATSVPLEATMMLGVRSEISMGTPM